MNQMLGNSSSGFFSSFLVFFLDWGALFYFSLSAMAFSSSVASSLATLSNNFSLYLSSPIFLSIYSGEEGAKSPNFSNIVSTLKGIWNFSYFLASGFFLFFLYFLLGSSSYLLFFDCKTSKPFSFFHWASALSLAAISAWFTFTSFLSSSSCLVSVSLRPLR